MRTDNEVNLHLLWAASLRQVNSYAARVAENRDVMPALDFARFILNSGLVKVLEPHACDGSLKVDAALVRWKAEELQRACQDRFRLNDTKPHVEELQLQCIHEKLNLIAGCVGKLIGTALPSAPELKVISGGLDDSPVAVSERNASA